MRKRLFYMLLKLKSALKLIPTLIAGTVLFGFIAFCVGFAGVKSLGNETNLFFKIAVVLPSDDRLVTVGFNMLTQMDSLKDYCEFIPTDDTCAKEMLKNNEVYGIVYIPKGFVEDVLNGQNTPAVVILPDNPGIETMLFRSVLNAGSNTLAYVQSGIYAMSDAYIQFGLADKIADSSEQLNNYYIRFVLNRSALFTTTTVSPTGTLSGAQFYICGGLATIILFLGFLCGGFITAESRGTSVMLKRSGINHIYSCVCTCLSLALSFTFIIAAILFIAKPVLSSTAAVPDDIIYTLSPQSVLSLFLCAAIATSFFFMVYTIAGSGLYGMLLLFCLNVVMLYCSGVIVPAAYLPKAAALIGKILPAAHMKNLCGALYLGTPSRGCVIAGIVYVAVFLLISAFIKERNCHEV